MDVIYIAHIAPRKWLSALIEKKHAFSIPAYKFNDLIIKGLKMNGARVHVPVDSSIWQMFSSEVQGDVYEEDGVIYYFLPKHTNLYQKIQNIRKWITKRIQENENIHILCDALFVVPTSIAVLCARKTKTKVTGIFTDLPEFLRCGKRSLKARTIEFVQRKILSKFDGYILLTEAMKNKIDRKGKPYMVMEGLVDADWEPTLKVEKGQKPICIYAGAIDKIYGITVLLESFVQANVAEAELHIYGSGDYEDGLRDFCKKQSSVKWFGVVPNEKILEAEAKATLLINPRPTDAEFTKYSFPSKNMEYMLSGTAVLTTKLPGMPKEYHPYVFLAEDESVEGWAKTLQIVLSMESSVLEEKGRQAQKFVREKKNNRVQAKRILNFMESL